MAHVTREINLGVGDLNEPHIPVADRHGRMVRGRNYFVKTNHTGVTVLRTCRTRNAILGVIPIGTPLAAVDDMKEPSSKRQRTLALQERAIRFSVNVNACCPEYFSNIPSKVVWGQLVRAADSASNNLVEADDAVSDADFLNKMGIALREAKESRTELMKLRLGSLDSYQKAAALELESEVTQLTAIFSTIIRNMRWRLEAEKVKRKNS